MITCENCKGDGIVGVGTEPWLKNGDNSTCKVCTGTGKVAEVVDQPQSADIPKVDSASSSADSSVDNSADAPAPETEPVL